MSTLEKREEIMSDLYGVFVEEAKKTTPLNYDKAMKAVTEAIVKEVESMDQGEMCQRVAHDLWNRFSVYAGKIHDQANDNIAKRKKTGLAARHTTGKTARTAKGGRKQ